MKPLNPFALTVSVPPHRHCGTTVRDRMLMILMAMLPAAVMAAMTFGMPAVRVMALSMAAAVLAEMACDYFMDRETDVHDLNAFAVGLSFAFLLPASAPWWLAAFGSAASIVLGKMVFGPLGGSPFCAPLIGWAICRISWPAYMDANASMLATDLTYPLAQLKDFGLDAVQITDTRQLFLGKQLGGLGAVQIAGVLLGGMLLVLRKHISSIIPVGVIGGAALTAFLFHWLDPSIYASPAFHLLTGSTLFGAFFLATDGPSSPNRQVPMLLFGLLIGALVIIIRVYGAYADGMPFAILLANLFTPVLERIRPKPFGRR
ncbi:Electron transport complex protein RnfD [Pseudodesulfovibrio hydrargyri]|uniref:Electron transport complex protein RnfD n=1 Tax=Pseudodesulfovibrio hydrargyri TaxID=2125990 RepID=A0A1J5NFV9_9BACT|nr:RnfABCDGE type electron transport complex subunit D [Pseudodesulfovibrio hydrargyri]OIQ50593.1 Electron transport complex protein RnfD [Pseudodesulfovibrio hydrargyri]